MKTRLALATTGQYRGMAHCVHHVVKSEGPLAFYRGILPSLIGIIPYAGIDVAIYEVSKAHCAYECYMSSLVEIILAIF